MRSLGFAITTLVLVALTFASSSRAKPSPPPSAPYRQQSLAELSDAALLYHMGPGRKAYEFECASILKNHVPPGFWTQDPKVAALSLAESHRTKEHRKNFKLIIDDQGAAQPPDSGSVAVTYASSRCYTAVDAFYFLRFDPAGSYLAYARSSSGGAVFYNLVHDQPVFDLRLCPLSYKDAHHLAAILWWLDRVHSRSTNRDSAGSFSMSISTADGFGELTLRSNAGTVLFERTGSLWAAELSERWSGDYNHEAFVNFASYLATRVLPQRLGKAWTDAAPRGESSAFFQRDQAPSYTDEELRHLARVTSRLLADFSPNQDRVSCAIVAAAAEAAGTLGFPEAKPSLEKILAELPELPPMRTFDQTRRELRDTQNEKSKSPEQKAARDKKLKALEAEQDAILSESGADSPRHLRGVVASSLRKLATADNPEALQAWAVAREADSQWALQRLSHVDPARYVQVLEVWMNQAEPRWARQIFEEINRVDSARATMIAAALPTEKAGSLTVAAFSRLQEAGRLTDEKERLNALMAVLQDPKSGWEERGKAINLLVPPEQPLRYPQREIDDALLSVLGPEKADDVVNFTLAAACRALALRHRTETFDRISKILSSTKDSFIHTGILDALVILAQADPTRLNPQLEKLVAPELTATNKQMTEILWAIWAADLRNLGPRLEQLGTSGPEDYEDEKAYSSGGEVTSVNGRFHLARKIADVWNAKDAVTHIRLLTALALDVSYEIVREPRPERVARFKTSLQYSARALTAEDRRRLEEFFKTVTARPVNDERENPALREEVVDWIKTLLALPNEPMGPTS